MLKIVVRSSAFELRKSIEDNKLKELKAKVIEILKKHDSNEVKKAIEYIESQEYKYTHLEKSLEGKWIEKAGYGVGTIRIWKGKKYKKVSTSPTRWVRVFDKNDRGAKSSMTRLIHKVQGCKDVNELYQFCMSNHALFQDDNGVDLPIMDQLRAAVDERKNAIENGGNKDKAKTENEIIKELENKVRKDAKTMSNEAIKKRIADIQSNLKAIEGISDYPTMNKVGNKEVDKNAKNEQLAQLKILSDELKNREESETEKQEKEMNEYSELTKKVYRPFHEALGELSRKVNFDLGSHVNLSRQQIDDFNKNGLEMIFHKKKTFKWSEAGKTTQKNVMNALDSKGVKYEATEDDKDYIVRIPLKEMGIEKVSKDGITYLPEESEAEKHENRSEAMKGNQNAKKYGFTNEDDLSKRGYSVVEEYNGMAIVKKGDKYTFAGTMPGTYRPSIRQPGFDSIEEAKNSLDKNIEIKNKMDNQKEEKNAAENQRKEENSQLASIPVGLKDTARELLQHIGDNANIASYNRNKTKQYELKTSPEGYDFTVTDIDSNTSKTYTIAKKNEASNNAKTKSKEDLQNDLLKLTKERSNNLKKIKNLHEHIMAVKESKYSGLADEYMMNKLDQDIKDSTKQINDLEDRNYQIEKEGNKITDSIKNLEYEEGEQTNKELADVPEKQQKAYNKVVEKIEKWANQFRAQMKHSNYVINGKPMNIVTDGKILIAQKGNVSTLPEGTIGSMERVYNVGNEKVNVPSGIDEIVKKAEKKVLTENGKVPSNTQFGDYVFNTEALQMAQSVLGGFEGANVVGDGNVRHAVRFEKGPYSVVLMPMQDVYAQTIAGSEAQKTYAEIKNKASSMSDEELKQHEKQLNDDLIHKYDASKDMATYQEKYKEWQIYYTEINDREAIRRANEEREAREKERAEKQARKAERDAKVKEKEAAGLMIRKPEDAIGNDNVEVAHSGSTLKFTDKDGHLLKMLRNATKAGDISPAKKFDLYSKLKKDYPELATPSGMNKIIIVGNDKYVLDGKKLYTLDGYKNRDVKKSMFDFLDVELVEDDIENIEDEEEENRIPTYDASQPELFNAIPVKVEEALNSVFGC